MTEKNAKRREERRRDLLNSFIIVGLLSQLIPSRYELRTQINWNLIILTKTCQKGKKSMKYLVCLAYAICNKDIFGINRFV